MADLHSVNVNLSDNASERSKEGDRLHDMVEDVKKSESAQAVPLSCQSVDAELVIAYLAVEQNF